MNLTPSEDEQLIRETARRLATSVVAPGARERDRNEAFPSEALAQLAEAGLLCMLVPSEYGGIGASAVGYALALREIARACASTAVTMAVTNMVADAIHHFGDETQRQKYLPRFATGAIGAFALSEPSAGSDAASLTTSAVRRGDSYRISGAKCWITSGDRAGLILVLAKTDPSAKSKGISAFLVEPGAPGLSVGKKEAKMGLRASSTVSLHFDDVEVPLSSRLGEEGIGFRIAMRALDGGRIGIGAQANGLHAACLDASRRYALERKQFGRAISEQQAIQWKLADMATELDAAELLVFRAATLKDGGSSFTREASMAKVYATEAANRAAREAVQIHGGYGYIDEFPVERYLRDVRVTTIYEGTSEIQRLVIAREILRSA